VLEAMPAVVLTCNDQSQATPRMRARLTAGMTKIEKSIGLCGQTASSRRASQAHPLGGE